MERIPLAHETSAVRLCIAALCNLPLMHVIRLVARTESLFFEAVDTQCPPQCLPSGDVGCCALGVPTAPLPPPNAFLSSPSSLLPHWLTDVCLAAHGCRIGRRNCPVAWLHRRTPPAVELRSVAHANLSVCIYTCVSLCGVALCPLCSRTAGWRHMLSCCPVPTAPPSPFFRFPVISWLDSDGSSSPRVQDL